MEKAKYLQADEGTVQHLIELTLGEHPERLEPELRSYARHLVNDGYPNAQLYADLLNAHNRLSDEVDEQREDALLGTMDALTGWCAPRARIY